MLNIIIVWASFGSEQESPVVGCFELLPDISVYVNNWSHLFKCIQSWNIHLY